MSPSLNKGSFSEGVEEGGILTGNEGTSGSSSLRPIRCMLLGDARVGKTNLTLEYLMLESDDHYTATHYEEYLVPIIIAGREFTINLLDTAGEKDYVSLRAEAYAASEVLVLCFSVVDRQSFNSLLLHWLPEIRRNTAGHCTSILLLGTQVDLRTSRIQGPAESSGCVFLEAVESDLIQDGPHESHHPQAGDTHRYDHHKKVFARPDSDHKQRYHKFSRHARHRVNHQRLHHDQDHDDHLRTDDTNQEQPDTHADDHQEPVSLEEGRRMAEELGAECYLECSTRSQLGLHEVFKNVVLAALRHRRNSTATTPSPATVRPTSINNVRSLAGRFSDGSHKSSTGSSKKKWSPARVLSRLFSVRSSFTLVPREVGAYRSMPSLFNKLTV